ncbi:MAG: hypothetical protein HY062_14850 [Bacteroidetes bacterium]|nr:hypothetical protein [Bacteroidota bacterium]
MATETTQDKEQKKGLLKKYLDNTFGDEGLRTDVKITLTNETILKFVTAVVVATGLSTATYYVIKAMFTKA